MEPVFFEKEFENKNLINHIVFICDHASNYIPRKYRKLGISDSDLESHIAFDIGAKNLTINLTKKLKQSYFLSNFSRLLIDPNRKKTDTELIKVRSFGVEIPENLHISTHEREYRINFFYNYYHKNLGNFVKKKINKYKKVFLVSIHSFTKKSKNLNRGIEVGLLWNKTMGLLLPIQRNLKDNKIHFGRNYPYSGFHYNYTIDRLYRNFYLENITIEIRNDLICDQKGIKKYVTLMSNIFKEFLNEKKP